MTRLRVRPRARADIDAASEYYATEGNKALARRFLESVERAFARITKHPLIGARMTVIEPTLTGLRSWPMPGFERHMVLYFATDDAVEVMRVLHSARGWKALSSEGDPVH